MRRTSLPIVAALGLSVSLTSAQVLPTVTGLPGLKQTPPLIARSTVPRTPKVQSPSAPPSAPMPRIVQLFRGKTNAPLPVLKPGVYETAPYSGIVIVPGPQADDRALIGGKESETGPSMPTVKPDLRFIPWVPGK